MPMDQNGWLSQLSVLRDFHSRRSSSWDRTGGNRDWVTIDPGRKHVLLEEAGAGCVRHFYWTYIEDREDRRMNIFRGLVLRAYWDAADRPSVEVPLGDFFGVTNGMVRPIRSLAFVTNPGRTAAFRSWGFNGYLPMPFAAGARIEIENQGGTPAGIWYHVDYELYARGSSLPAGTGRLNAEWRREPRTEPVAPPPGADEIKNLTGEDNYTVLEATGDGQFAGYFLTVVNGRRDWWGEGDDMIFIDGDAWPPAIHGTGSEEIFGGGACPAIEYTGPYTGFHCIENRAGYPWWGTNGMYRFYIADPIRFRSSIRVSIEHGHGNDLANDYSSVAFWYQSGPPGDRAELPDLRERLVNFQD